MHNVLETMLRVIDWKKKGKTRKGSLNETEDTMQAMNQIAGFKMAVMSTGTLIDNANECGASNNVVRPRFGFDSKQTFWL